MATEILDHWVAGKTFTGASTRTSPVYNPAQGVVQREVRLATTADVDAAVQAAKSAFPTSDVYGTSPTPALRLITCDGTFDTATGHYTDNLIVFATLVHD